MFKQTGTQVLEGSITFRSTNLRVCELGGRVFLDPVLLLQISSLATDALRLECIN